MSATPCFRAGAAICSLNYVSELLLMKHYQTIPGNGIAGKEREPGICLSNSYLRGIQVGIQVVLVRRINAGGVCVGHHQTELRPATVKA